MTYELANNDITVRYKARRLGEHDLMSVTTLAKYGKRLRKVSSESFSRSLARDHWRKMLAAGFTRTK